MKDSASLDNKFTEFNAFNLISWIAVIGGIVVYLSGLWRSGMQLNEKGYYFAILILGLFSSISIQKTVRDKTDNIPTTQAYYIACIIAFLSSIALIAIGLFNADLLPSEKGFYGIAFFLCLFGSIAVQKNIRDMELTKSPVKKEFNTKSISEDN
ncbi:inner membrane protein YiaA [Xenorhabdus stockiae]|uniref:inner membrane protein YiaA n=1 Tax=Xenorhabdus stockiae TaxID=351614 RepID=UPI0040644B5E